MLFNSIPFLIFFPIVYGLYVILNHRWQNRLLIIASLLFYAFWSWKFLGVMLISITTDFWCARKIKASSSARARKAFLSLSITVNLAILFIFKYFNFFISNAVFLLRNFPIFHSLDVRAFNIILPLGISFYTFEAISYVVDVYRDEVEPARRYGDYLLFVIYFPHMIAGPIMRGKSFLPQIIQPRLLNLDQFYEGCFLFFWGLFEKIFVADNLGLIVNPIYGSASSYDGATVLVAVYAFAFQIFCDFDGYSNMARGLGKCMGFDIAVNFNLPYFAANIQEFWNRWHITLSSWVRDYLFYPLAYGLSWIKGNARIYVSLLITMTLLGLWHGAAWHFVLFGVYHGVLLIACALIREHCSGFIAPKTSWGRLVWLWARIILTFHLAAFGFMLFRCSSMAQLGAMIKALAVDFHPTLGNAFLFLKFVGLVLPLWLVQIFQYRSNDLLVLRQVPWTLRAVCYAVLTYLALAWGVLQTDRFIYFQF